MTFSQLQVPGLPVLILTMTELHHPLLVKKEEPIDPLPLSPFLFESGRAGVPLAFVVMHTHSGWRGLAPRQA